MAGHRAKEADIFLMATGQMLMAFMNTRFCRYSFKNFFKNEILISINIKMDINMRLPFCILFAVFGFIWKIKYMQIYRL